MMKTLTIIGGGRVGKTLGRLWREQGVFSIRDVLTRSLESSEEAAAFIGAGRPAAAIANLQPAQVYLIATPDAAITPVCEALAASGALQPNALIFHCSGALASDALAAAKRLGAFAGSIHPAKSFANAADAVETFSGTYCAAEGDEVLLAEMTPAFEKIGAVIFAIRAEDKIGYHAAMTLMCNYTTVLLDIGLRCCARAGLDGQTAAAVAEPLVAETVKNAFKLGPAAALTGPVVRGDAATVKQHLAWLSESGPRFEEIYRCLGLAALDLAQRPSNDAAELSHGPSAEQALALERLLQS